VPRFAPLEVSKLGFFQRKTYTLECRLEGYTSTHTNYLYGGLPHVPQLNKGLSIVLDYRQSKNR